MAINNYGSSKRKNRAKMKPRGSELRSMTATYFQ